MVRATWRSRRATRCRSTAEPTGLAMINPRRGPLPASRPLARRTCTMTSGCTVRIPYFTVASNSVDRLMRLCAGSTAREPDVRSGRQRAAALAAPAGHDRTPGAGTHAQTETMHAGSAPVIGLEGPLALGHGVLLVVCGSNIRAIRPHILRNCVGPQCARSLSCYWPARSPSLSFRCQFGSQPHRRLSGDFLRVLTCLRWVKPGLLQRDDPPPRLRTFIVGQANRRDLA
jgi:hypothetical protein